MDRTWKYSEFFEMEARIREGNLSITKLEESLNIALRVNKNTYISFYNVFFNLFKYFFLI